MACFVFQTWKYRSLFAYFFGMNLDHSIELEFSTIHFAMLARGLHKAIQMMDQNFFVLESGNYYLSARVFFKSSDVDLRDREILF